MITKDGRDTPIEQLTPENYVVPEREKQSYHFTLELRHFDQNTGKRLSVPRVQKCGKKMFKQNYPIWKKQGYTVTILFDPIAYETAQRQALAKAAEQKKADEAPVEPKTAKKEGKSSKK